MCVLWLRWAETFFNGFSARNSLSHSIMRGAGAGNLFDKRKRHYNVSVSVQSELVKAAVCRLVWFIDWAGLFALDQTPCIVCKKSITRITLEGSRNTINLVALGINNSLPQSSHDNNPRLMVYCVYWPYCTTATIQICFANIMMFCNLYIMAGLQQ